MALDREGNLWTWGYNGDGQLGDGSKINRTNPVQIQKGTKFKQVSAGNSHSMAIDSDGNLWTWGWNGHGILGDGTTTDRTNPVQIKNEKNLYKYPQEVDIV